MTAFIEYLSSSGEKQIFPIDESRTQDFLIYSVTDRKKVNDTIINGNMCQRLKLIGVSNDITEIFSASGRSWFDEPVSCVDHHRFTEPTRFEKTDRLVPAKCGVKVQTLAWLVKNPDKFVCIIPKHNNGEYMFGFTKSIV